MTDAVLKFINKYHIAHFGFDLNRGSMKMKNTVSNYIERAYHEVPFSFTTVQDSIKHLTDQGKDAYMTASDSLMSMRAQDVIGNLAHEAKQVLKDSEDKIFVLLDAAREYLRDAKFTVPGSEEQLSSLEMLQRARRSVSRAADRAIQRFGRLMEQIFKHIREIEFTIPGINVVVNGSEIMDQLKSSITFAYDQLKHLVSRGFDLLHKAAEDLFLVLAEKGENLIIYLRDETVEIAPQIDAIHAEVLRSTKEHIDEAKRYVAEYKDLTKLKIQEAYHALNMERVNNDTRELISIFQSHLYGGLNEGVDLMRRASQSTEPYIRVSNKKMDIEIPLPFLWKSFSDWPTPSRH